MHTKNASDSPADPVPDSQLEGGPVGVAPDEPDKKVETPDEPPVPRGSKCDIEIRHMTNKGEEIKYGLDNMNSLEDSSYAISVTRKYDHHGAIKSSTLQINSPHLLAVFKEVIGAYPGMPINFAVPFEITDPYDMLYHYWEPLQAYYDEQEAKREPEGNTNVDDNQSKAEGKDSADGKDKAKAKDDTKAKHTTEEKDKDKAGAKDTTEEKGKDDADPKDMDKADESNGKAKAPSADDDRNDPQSHLKLLLDFMGLEMGRDRNRVKSLLSGENITFDLLWAIFRPGELVYTSVNGHDWLLKLERTGYEGDGDLTRGRWLEVYASYTCFNGTEFGTATTFLKLSQREFFAADNPCKINKLEVYPANWLENRAEIEEKLAERGSKYLAIDGVQVKNYSGIARFMKEPPFQYFDAEMDFFAVVWMPYTESGRVILDAKTCKEENAKSTPKMSPSAGDYTSRSERMLCCPYVLGYSLSRKDWAQYYVDSISEIEWQRDALDQLVLSEPRKAVLEALVFSHEFSITARDETKTKGKGLVVLLHGSPGSGKTLTAESVAEVSKKALVSSTLGDLSRDGNASFEMRLRRLLLYASIWKAIVLLDEADVFLEARTEAVGDFGSHNSLVAVFLKHLEYFSGIVFLTSNRVRVFDRAMKSRIHLALEYNPPDASMRRRIWGNCLAAVPAAERGDELASKEQTDRMVGRFLAEEVNGREIANCVRTARTLARFKNVRLSGDHVETVLATRREFDRSLEKMKEQAREFKRKNRDGAGGRLIRRNTLDAGSDGE